MLNRQLTICLVLLLIAGFSVSCGTPGQNYLDTATKAAVWMSSTSVADGFQSYWPSQPDTMKRGEISLYHGVPGGILFFLEMYKATEIEEYEVKAQEATDWLLDQAHKVNGGYYWTDISVRGEPYPDHGLYTGTAGAGTVLMELSKYFDNSLYRMYSRGAAHYLVEHMRQFEKGAAWNTTTDIVSGAAGTGLFLVKAGQYYEDEDFLNAAKEVGAFLISEAIEDEPGIKWKARPNDNRIYPNFSHGTSGVAFFLAVLYQATNDRRFLDAAAAGAEWLKAHEEEHAGKGLAWYHHEPGGKDLYYVSWCHGPGGTARLFYQLYLATGDEEWMNMVKQSAEWLMTCGLIEKPLDGFWNVSICCGNAGIADFFADLYKLTGDERYWQWAVTMTEDLTQKAVPGSPGLKWVQAENRTRPDEVTAQTGFSQGAAGIGLLYLKMYAFSHSKQPFSILSLPDSPFNWEFEENKLQKR